MNDHPVAIKMCSSQEVDITTNNNKADKAIIFDISNNHQCITKLYAVMPGRHMKLHLCRIQVLTIV